ncbi:MAG: DUF1460 domain-containing protein [Rickettsiales bacterium]|jgi:hypothetical protein|nr:DUF1460 domain-containing protein [Rickettsiales bacterium]
MKNISELSLALLFLLASCGLGASDRIGEVSARFLGAPYIEDPLGEGEGAALDPDPLWRFDAFDCLTYVETVLALANSDSEEGFEKAMREIRYKGGEVSFLSRNHFTSIDWIPNNARYVADLTEGLSMDALSKPASVHNVRIDKGKWFKNAHGIDVEAEPEEVSVAYVALGDLLAAPEKLEAAVKRPMIANVVVKYRRLQDRIGTDMDIAHTGFLLPTERGLLFRHASRRAGSVVDIGFFEYLEFLKGYPQYKGINFVGIK